MQENPYAPPSGDRPDLPPRQVNRPPQDAPPGRQSGPPPAPPPAPRPPVQPEELRLLRRKVLAFGLLTMAGLFGTTLPVPWQLIGTTAAAAAVVLGIRVISATRRSPLRRSLMPMLTIGLAIASLYLFSSLASLATWDLQVARQECLGRALTVAAREECEAEFRQAVTGGLVPEPSGSPSPTDPAPSAGTLEEAVPTA